MKTTISIFVINHRYPNLIKQIQWVASVSTSDARLILWAYKNKLSSPVAGSRVALFGGVTNLVHKAAHCSTRNA